MRTMHLFAGAGGGLLADLILGHAPVVAVEWDAYCCQVLRERAAEGWFPGLHVYEGDVRMFNPSDYAGRVDCIHAGFPCQDISHAGNRAGVGADTRSGLYREVLRVADVVRPKYLFLENVAAILGNGLGTVLGDLAARGYDTRWTCVSAAVAGAPHQRDRWWLLAAHPDSGNGSAKQKSQYERPEKFGGGGAGAVESHVADADEHAGHQGWPSDASQEQRGRHAHRGCVCANDPDAFSVNAQGQQSCGTDAQGWAGPHARASRPFRDGHGWWPTEPNVGRVANGVAFRVDRLKALGNGQVPLQAALAWRIVTDA